MSNTTDAFLASVDSSERAPRVTGRAISDEVMLETHDVNVYYGDNHALHDTSLKFHTGEITALIGPSGCGKSTFLRSLNLMNREIRGCRVTGEIVYEGRNINTKTENLYELRRSIGMVFQQPNPFPQVHPREHHVRAQAPRPQGQGHPRPARGGEPPRRGAVGRGQGQAG